MKIDGVILAGGLSSRMGQDKALLTRDHRDMFFYTLDTVQALSLSDIFISRNPSQVSYLTRLTTVSDQFQNLGPLGGIHAIAQQSHADALLIVPIDLPLLETKDLEKLISMGEVMHKPIYFHDHYLPLFLPLNDTTRNYLNDVVTGQVTSKSVKAMCRHFQGISLSPDNQGRLQNTNTPEQWLAAKLEIMDM